ncbi:uncharacterized protein [Salminus brasiliensis]|uniref:uncharacterized protein n=1 Tax=Salminus brasiliensis TaxID=930266 RepID=UPI003B82DD97
MMKIEILLTVLLVYHPEVQSQDITRIEVVVNDPITLPCGIECPGEAKWSIFIPIKADVAHCDRETCWVEDGFQKRFTVSGDRTRGNISLLIRAVAYNDKGSYRCSCDGKTAEVKLRVFVPMVVKVQELEDVTLPCYGDTRKDDKDVQWKKDGRKVVQYIRESGTVTPGQGFEDRFVLSPEAFKDGDLSLHISSFHPSDAGLYLCSFHDESIDGEPRAVLLQVKDSSRSWCPGTVIVLLSAILALASVVFLCWKKRRSIQDTSDPPDERVLNPPHPVQEQSQCLPGEESSSKPMDKISSTMPFLDSLS